MKNKFLMSVTAVAMSLAMVTTAMAAPIERGTGEVDDNNVVNSNDASMIYKSAMAETDLEEGNFDGDWRTRDSHMDTVDASRVLGYVLQPENYTEKVGLRFYSKSSTAIDGGAFKFFTDSELDSEKCNWNEEYLDHEAKLEADSNMTIDQAVSEIASNENNGWNSEAIDQLKRYLGGIYFIGDHGTAGTRVCFTTEEGWTIFNHAMRAIVPVSKEDLANYAPTRLVTSLYPDQTGIYENISELTPEEQARVEAFKELKSYVVTNVDYETAIDSSNPMVLADMYNAFKKAFPSDELTEDMIRTTADRFAEIYTRRYDINTETQNGSGDSFVNGNENGVNSQFVNKICENKLYAYETATLQDVRDTFGDQITISTTKRADEEEGDQLWSFTIEFYTRYVEK